MWSFVQKKANKQWIWIAMDAKTRQIIAFHVGDRSGASGKQLWGNVPEAYQQQAALSRVSRDRSACGVTCLRPINSRRCSTRISMRSIRA
jgi:IS1 family transposase